MPQPSVGRVVHYVSYGTPGGEYGRECRAAIVTAVPERLVAEPMDGCPNGTGGEWIASLAVFGPSGAFFDQNVPQHEAEGGGQVSAASHPGGTWHWPERVDG
jgi:hypothetical protein